VISFESLLVKLIPSEMGIAEYQNRNTTGHQKRNWKDQLHSEGLETASFCIAYDSYVR